MSRMANGPAKIPEDKRHKVTIWSQWQEHPDFWSRRKEIRERRQSKYQREFDIDSKFKTAEEKFLSIAGFDTLLYDIMLSPARSTSRNQPSLRGWTLKEIVMFAGFRIGNGSWRPVGPT